MESCLGFLVDYFPRQVPLIVVKGTMTHERCRGVCFLLKLSEQHFICTSIGSSRLMVCTKSHVNAHGMSLRNVVGCLHLASFTSSLHDKTPLIQCTTSLKETCGT